MGIGCLGTVALLTIAAIVGSASEKAGLIVFASSGLLQLAYVIPLALKYHRTGAKNSMAGLLIEASLALLFCASCGALLLSFSSGSMH
jgi:hypothetical protein